MINGQTNEQAGGSFSHSIGLSLIQNYIIQHRKTKTASKLAVLYFKNYFFETIIMFIFYLAITIFSVLIFFPLSPLTLNTYIPFERLFISTLVASSLV